MGLTRNDKSHTNEVLEPILSTIYYLHKSYRDNEVKKGIKKNLYKFKSFAESIKGKSV